MEQKEIDNKFYDVLDRLDYRISVIENRHEKRKKFWLNVRVFLFGTLSVIIVSYMMHILWMLLLGLPMQIVTTLP